MCFPMSSLVTITANVYAAHASLSSLGTRGVERGGGRGRGDRRGWGGKAGQIDR